MKNSLLATAAIAALLPFAVLAQSNTGAEVTVEDCAADAENAGDCAQEGENALEAAGQAVEEGAEAVAEGAEDAAEGAEEMAEDAGQAVEEGAEEVAEGAEDAAEGAEEMAEDAGQAVEEGAEEVAEGAEDAAEGAEEMAEDAAAGTPGLRNPWQFKDAEGTDMVLTAEEIIGARVIDAKEDDIGEIHDLLFSDLGDPESALIDVGGFLGLGEHTVSVKLEELTVERQVDNPDIWRIRVDMTEEQLESMPEYEPES